MVRLLARLRRSFESRPKPARRRSARPDVELLEFRAQPATGIAPDLVAGSDTGISSMDNVTSIASPRFAGITTSPPGTTISLMVDGAANGCYVIPHTGGSIFALQPTAPLVAGSHTVQFLDSHTNHLSAALAIDIVTAAPTTSADFSLDPANTTTTATALHFDGTGQPGTTATLFFDGAIQATATVAGDGSYRFVVDPVAPGSHEAFVTLTDLAGNVSTPSAPVDIAVVAPFAVDAGPDQTVNEGATVQLAATGIRRCGGYHRNLDARVGDQWPGPRPDRRPRSDLRAAVGRRVRLPAHGNRCSRRRRRQRRSDGDGARRAADPGTDRTRDRRSRNRVRPFAERDRSRQ